MRPLLNTLFVTTQGAYVAKDGETLQVRVDGETKLQLPIHTIHGVVCFGNVLCSPAAMGLCAERKVGISFLSEHGRFLARVEGRPAGSVLVRREQFRWAEDWQKRAEVARTMVAAKTANCRIVLQRSAREREGGEGTERLLSAAARLAGVVGELETAETVERIRGLEGDAARVYFEVFDELIVASKDEFRFAGRNRRPPLDNMNALLSFLYVLLAHDCEGAVAAAGLDPSVGFLHADRPGRASLALDLMEELRPVIADRVALSLVNRKQVLGSGFEKTESGAVTMNDATRKEVLVAYQKRKQEEVEHPFLGEKMPVGLIAHVQAQLLARHIRGSMNAYPAYFWR